MGLGVMSFLKNVQHKYQRSDRAVGMYGLT